MCSALRWNGEFARRSNSGFYCLCSSRQYQPRQQLVAHIHWVFCAPTVETIQFFFSRENFVFVSLILANEVLREHLTLIVDKKLVVSVVYVHSARYRATTRPIRGHELIFQNLKLYGRRCVYVYVLFNWICNFLVVTVVVFPSLLAVRVPCDVVSRLRCISCFSCINEQLYTSSSSSVAAANYAHITHSLDHTNIEPFNSTHTFTNTKCFERFFFFFCLSLCQCLWCSMSARVCVSMARRVAPSKCFMI